MSIEFDTLMLFILLFSKPIYDTTQLKLVTASLASLPCKEALPKSQKTNKATLYLYITLPMALNAPRHSGTIRRVLPIKG